MPFYKNNKNNHGFSLLELILGASISVILVLVLTQFVGIISSIQKYLGDKLPAQGDIEQALQAMVVDIRSAGQSSAGAYAIESASSTNFIFFSDTDRDGLMERVRYTVGTSTLQRGVVKPSGNPLQYVTSTETISTPVSNLIGASSSFAYYDTNFTGTQAPLVAPINLTTIRAVGVTLTVDVSTTTAPAPTVVTEIITIRNLKSN